MFEAYFKMKHGASYATGSHHDRGYRYHFTRDAHGVAIPVHVPYKTDIDRFTQMHDRLILCDAAGNPIDVAAVFGKPRVGTSPRSYRVFGGSPLAQQVLAPESVVVPAPASVPTEPTKTTKRSRAKKAVDSSVDSSEESLEAVAAPVSLEDAAAQAEVSESD